MKTHRMAGPRLSAGLVGVLVSLAACGDGPAIPPLEAPLDLAAPWETANPGAAGIDGGLLEQADAAARAIPRMRSLLVVRHGRLVHEAYYGDRDRDTRADSRSVTKSIVSTLVGIAIDRGVLTLDQSIGDLLTSPDFDLRADQRAITVQHLLTMTGGWEWSESGSAGYGEWIASEDHVRYLLDRPLSDVPGSRFNYNSAAVFLLGIVLAEAVDQPLEAWADEVLFAPLGIEAVWESLPERHTNAGSGIDLTPRDLARIGQLMLQQGRSGDQALVSSEWVTAATVRHHSWTRSAGPIGRASYGLLWWIDTDRNAFFAWGYGGQFIFVVPSLALVVVANTEWGGLSQDTGGSNLSHQVLDVIVNHVLDAAS